MTFILKQFFCQSDTHFETEGVLIYLIQ